MSFCYFFPYTFVTTHISQWIILRTKDGEMTLRERMTKRRLHKNYNITNLKVLEVIKIILGDVFINLKSTNNELIIIFPQCPWYGYLRIGRIRNWCRS